MGEELRKSVDIEQLLQWTYLDELPKRQISSAEGIWDRLAQYGSLGGVNPDPGGAGNAQRYAQFGLPHKDAELIEIAVNALGSSAVDWHRDFDLIADDLAALITINDVSAGLRPAPPDPWRAEVDAAPDGRGVSSRVIRDARRDVLLLNSVNVAALLHMHAIKRTRPDWRTEQMRCVPTPAEHGPLGKIIGICKGKNRYTTGSYCPLLWKPSPVEVAKTRADYLLWHQALIKLAATLKLTEHEALPPAAEPTPWITGEISHRTLGQGAVWPTPFRAAAPRAIAGAPLKKPRGCKVRRVPVDRWSKA